jgi:hypothetical protein
MAMAGTSNGVAGEPSGVRGVVILQSASGFAAWSIVSFGLRCRHNDIDDAPIVEPLSENREYRMRSEVVIDR